MTDDTPTECPAADYTLCGTSAVEQKLLRELTEQKGKHDCVVSRHIEDFIRRRPRIKILKNLKCSFTTFENNK